MDRVWLYSTLIVWLIFQLGEDVNCQFGGNPIGAHRQFKKTSFSCTGRSNGYYADIETGCQVYHMCDGLGRQFTYSCPNTTLFQQRMLICDHWYMVNCSKAESDYDANLLIGQRDKPFVPDNEHQQRTPRPDLLDRPYAPDYSGESFRNQYKQIPPVLNHIDDTHQDSDFEQPLDHASIQLNPPPPPPPSSTRWRIIPPSRDVLPPGIDPIVVGIRRMDDTEEHGTVDLGTSFSSNYNTSADVSSEEDSSPVAPTKSVYTTPQTQLSSLSTPVPTKYYDSNIITSEIKTPSKLYEPPFLYPIYNENYTASGDEFVSSTAAPFTARIVTTSTTPVPPSPPLTRPTTSAGRPFARYFQSTIPSPTPTPYRTTTTTEPTTETLERAESSSSIRANFNNYDFSRFVTAPTTAPTISAPSTQTQQLNERLQPENLPSRPIVVSPEEQEETSAEPNIAENLQPPIAENPDSGSSIFDFRVPTGKKLELPSPFAQRFIPAASQGPDVKQPSNELEPPLFDFIEYDVATTQGPPIYYEWKIPSNALEPPSLDTPIGVPGRVIPDYLISDPDDITDQATPEQQQFATNIDEHKVQEQQLQLGSFGQRLQHQTLATSQSTQFTNDFPFAHNPFLSSLATKSQRSVDHGGRNSPTPRSILPRASIQPLNDIHVEGKISTTRKPTTELEIQQIKRDLLVPDFLFPLEDGRTGYELGDTVNSFQLKIPKQLSEIKGKNWYGENIKCPECHPSFVKPGTCEPCVKKR